MVVGVNGEDVAKHEVLELRQEPVPVQKEELNVLNVHMLLDLQVKIVTLKHARRGTCLVGSIAGTVVERREVIVRIFVAPMATAVEVGGMIVLVKLSKSL